MHVLEYHLLDFLCRTDAWGQGLRFIMALSHTHPYVLAPSSVSMARRVRSMARRMQAPDSFSHRKRYGVLGTTSSTILCGQVIRSTQRLRASAPPSTVVHVYYR